VRRVSTVIEEVVGFLEDGRWHTFAEIRDGLGIPEAKLSEVLKFLERFGFLCVDKEEKKVKLTSSFLQLPI